MNLIKFFDEIVDILIGQVKSAADIAVNQEGILVGMEHNFHHSGKLVLDDIDIVCRILCNGIVYRMHDVFDFLVNEF